MFSHEERQEVRLYFANLYHWDEEGESLYKSISWTFPNNKPGSKPGDPMPYANYAAQSMDSLVNLVETRYRRDLANIYACFGEQRLAKMEKTTTDGYPKAFRATQNMVRYKSVALDIDAKKKGAYATTEDAFAALDGFITATGLPPPTMEVYSGSGGLHIYWCFKTPVPHANWLVLAKGLRDAAQAYGLKFDPQCTVNAAGILRVPNTFNWKQTPPAKVRLYREAHHTFTQYDYQMLASTLAPYLEHHQPHASAVHAGATPVSGMRTANQAFAAGLDETSPPVSIDDIAVNCPTIADILLRGGNGDAEPLWNLGLLAASFTTDPHDAAHRMSDQDPRYSKDGTNKKLSEKLNARAQNPSLGWPTCDGFSKLHTACATCPLFAQRKTPFHHADRPRVFTTSGATVRPGNDPLMPDKWWRDQNNHVWGTVGSGDKEYTAEIIRYPVLDGSLADDGSINYKALVSGVERMRNILVSANMQPVGTAQALAKDNGLFIEAKYHTPVRDFLVAWTSHLQTIHKVSKQSSYGWGDNCTTFGFDDKIYSETKVETVYKGKNHDKNFVATGKIAPWQDAMALVYGNPALECIVASAFAAPLIELIATTSVVLSAYSKNSGVGKSTAMALGQAVWGHPRGGMSTLLDTTNSMMKKITDLRSLPLYWDELRTKGQLEKVIEIIFSVTQGKGKARLTREVVQAEASPFTTMFIVASNYGLSDTVYHQTEATDAGGLRLFEIEPLAQKSSLTSFDANRLMLKVQNNYGVVGAQYASWLAQDRKKIEDALKVISADMNKEYKFETRERFWEMTMISLLAGASFANVCGFTKFDIVALRAFLGESLARQRGGVVEQSYSTLATGTDAVGVLGELRIEQHNRSLVITDRIHYGGGRPPVQVPTHDTDLSKISNVWVQYGVLDGRWRLLVRPFNDWLRKRGINPRQFKDMLKGHYYIQQSKQSVGAGVVGLDAAAARAECYDLTPVSPPAPAPSRGSS